MSSIDKRAVFFKLSFYDKNKKAELELIQLKRGVTGVIEQKKKIREMKADAEALKKYGDESAMKKYKDLDEKVEHLAEDIFEDLLINREACRRLGESDDKDLAEFAGHYEREFSSLLLKYKDEFDFTRSSEKMFWHSYLTNKDVLKAELQLILSLNPNTKSEEEKMVRLSLVRSEVCHWFSEYKKDEFAEKCPGGDYNFFISLAEKYEAKFRRAASLIVRNSRAEFDDIGIGYA